MQRAFTGRTIAIIGWRNKIYTLPSKCPADTGPDDEPPAAKRIASAVALMHEIQDGVTHELNDHALPHGMCTSDVDDAVLPVPSEIPPLLQS